MTRITYTLMFFTIFMWSITTLSAQFLTGGDPLCPPDITVAPDGTVQFTFPVDPGFDITAIGSAPYNTAPPATTVYTGSGSFTSPFVYTLEPDVTFPVNFMGDLVVDFSGTGFIVCNYANNVPLELLFFDGRTTEQNTNVLNWATATESNTEWIILERSTDTENWGMVERLPAQGWSTDIIEYSAEDFNPFIKTYYRLHMIDLDGYEYYSDVVFLERSSLGEVVISPIPAKDNVFLQFEATNEDDITITVIDIYGRELSKEIVTTTIGLNTIDIDISQYASGLYYVTLDNGIDKTTKRILRQE